MVPYLFTLPNPAPSELQFNFTGEVVFQSTASDAAWDGRFKGDDLPNGVYIWRITYIDSRTGKYGAMQGDVTLLR